MNTTTPNACAHTFMQSFNRQTHTCRRCENVFFKISRTSRDRAETKRIYVLHNLHTHTHPSVWCKSHLPINHCLLRMCRSYYIIDDGVFHSATYCIVFKNVHSTLSFTLDNALHAKKSSFCERIHIHTADDVCGSTPKLHCACGAADDALGRT